MLKVSKPVSVPIYRQICAELKRQIEEGVLVSGDFMPTEQELADMFGVTRLTLRKGLAELEKEGYIKRRPGAGAIVTRPRSTTRIGVLCYGKAISPARGNFYGGILAEVGLAAGERHARVLLMSVATHSQKEVADLIREESLCGMILLGVMDDAMIQDLSGCGVPVVLVDCAGDAFGLDSVVVDDFGGGRALTRHLIDAGHRRIAYIGGLRREPDGGLAKEASSAERCRGYRAALAEAGIEEEFVVEESIGVPGGISAMKRLLDSDPGITAVFSFDGSLATGAAKAARDAGLELPRDLSVVVFNDSNKDPVHRLRLTTTAIQDSDAMGRMAVELLLKRAGSDKSAKPEKRVVAVELIEGESVAPPRR